MILSFILIGFLSLRLGSALWNLFGNPRLSEFKNLSQNHKLSILIPAKNEEHNILNLLKSIKNQDFQNYEVFVLDDQSSDQTYALVSEFIEDDIRFKVVKGQDLPPNWLGKSFACYQLGKLATGDYFLFLDADVIVKPGLFSKALGRVFDSHLTLLSLFADQKMITLGEWCTVPLMNYFLLSFLPLPLIKKSKQETVAAANGQFMLFPGHSYLKYQWHLKVRSNVAEDYEICKQVKSHGLSTETLLSDGFLHCRMYNTMADGINGFTKNTFALLNNNLSGALLFLFMIAGLDLWMIFKASWTMILIVFLQVISLRIIISISSKQNLLLNLILHPIQMVLMIYITLRSIWKNYAGTLYWKGRSIHPELMKTSEKPI